MKKIIVALLLASAAVSSYAARKVELLGYAENKAGGHVFVYDSKCGKDGDGAFVASTDEDENVRSTGCIFVMNSIQLVIFWKDGTTSIVLPSQIRWVKDRD